MLEIITPTTAAQFTYSIRNGYMQVELFNCDGRTIAYKNKISFSLQPQNAIKIKNCLSSLKEAYKNKIDFKYDMEFCPYKDNDIIVKFSFFCGKNSENIQKMGMQIIANVDKNGYKDKKVCNVKELCDITAIDNLLDHTSQAMMLFDLFKLQDIINFRASKNGALLTTPQNGTQILDLKNGKTTTQPDATLQELVSDDGFGFDGDFQVPEKPIEEPKQEVVTVVQDTPINTQSEQQSNFEQDTQVTSQFNDNDSPSDLDDILNSIGNFQEF